MTATLRPARVSDEVALFALARAFPTPTPPTLEAFREALEAKLADAASAVFVAELDGQLVGYVAGYAHATFYAAGLTAWVDEVFVLPHLRGTGLGKVLMGAFEGWALDRRCILVGLATRGAVPFYERLGYASTAGYFKKYLASTPS